MTRPGFLRLTAAWCAVLVAGGLVARGWVAKDRPLCGYMDNDDATAHVLVTCEAYSQTTPAVHRYLPIFTLGRPADKWVDDLPQAAAPDRDGNYYYTSFPPGGFVVPYAVIHGVLGRPVTANALRRFNLALHGLLVAVSVGLLYRALGELTPDRSSRWLGALSAGVVLWTAREMLTSYTISYWAQQVYQVVFALQLVCLCTRRVGVGFFALCLVGCLTEWTAYLVNAGVVGYGLLRYWAAGDRRGLLAAGVAAAATLVGGLLLLAWYAQVMPLDAYLARLTGRFGERKGGMEDAVGLAKGYLRSAGPFLAIGLLAACRAARHLADCDGYDRRVHRLLTEFPQLTAIVGLTAWSVAENLLLMNHATAYSFDRVKVVYLLAVLAGVLVARTGSRTLTCGLLFAGTLSLVHFTATARPATPVQRAWRHLDEYTGALVRQAAPDGTELVFINQVVRGSKVYYAGRNLVELPDGPNHPDETIGDVLPEVLRQSRERGATTAVVFLAPDAPPSDPAAVFARFPRPPAAYRVDVATGAATRIAFPDP